MILINMLVCGMQFICNCEHMNVDIMLYIYFAMEQVRVCDYERHDLQGHGDLQGCRWGLRGQQVAGGDL